MPAHFSLTALVAIFTAVAFALIGVRRATNRTPEKIAGLLADGAATGPLLLIVISPFAQVFGIGPDFYEEVFKHETMLLWWASSYAVLNLIWKLL